MNIFLFKKFIEKFKGILKYLGFNIVLFIILYNEFELVLSIMGEMLVKMIEDVFLFKRFVEKCKGIFKYMGFDCFLFIVVYDEQEFCFLMSEVFYFYVDLNDDVMMFCNLYQDFVEGIDFEMVDVEEQWYILEGIY